MIALVVVLALSSQDFADDCSNVQYADLCNATFGCLWAGSGSGCVFQPDYDEGTLNAEPYTCSNPDLTGEDGTLPDGYECYIDPFTHHYYVYIGAYYDGCSFEEFVSEDGTCPPTAYKADNSPVECDVYVINENGGTGCFEKLDDSQWQYPEAGLCYNRSIAGCGAFPNCDYNNGSCKPDIQCYYDFANQNPCRNGSDGPCRYYKIPAIFGDEICSTDILLRDNIACIESIYGAGSEEDAKSACEGAKCEFVSSGTAPLFGDYSYWCAPKGSDASVVKVSAFVIAILLTSIFAVL